MECCWSWQHTWPDGLGLCLSACKGSNSCRQHLPEPSSCSCMLQDDRHQCQSNNLCFVSMTTTWSAVFPLHWTPYCTPINLNTEHTISVVIHLSLTDLNKKYNYCMWGCCSKTSVQQLIEKLRLLGLNICLCNWILDPLTVLQSTAQITSTSLWWHYSHGSR